MLIQQDVGSRNTIIEKEIKDITKGVDEDLELSKSYEEKLEKYDSVDTDLSQLRIYENRFKDKQKAFKKEYKFFESNEHCPTCNQSITENFRSDKKAEITINSERSTKQQSNSKES